MGIFSYVRLWDLEICGIANCFVLSSRTNTDITEIKVKNWIPRPVTRRTTASKYSKANSNLKKISSQHSKKKILKNLNEQF